MRVPQIILIVFYKKMRLICIFSIFTYVDNVSNIILIFWNPSMLHVSSVWFITSLIICEAVMYSFYETSQGSAFRLSQVDTLTKFTSAFRLTNILFYLKWWEAIEHMLLIVFSSCTMIWKVYSFILGRDM